MRSPLRFVVLLAVAACCLSCSSDDSSLVRASLGIEARDNDGRHAEIGCEELPLLQGSNRYTRHIIDDVITITVTAVPSEIRLVFDAEGTTLSDSRTVPRAALLRDFAEEIDVLLYDGDIYTISLSSRCAE
jgi:hypothetical protein